MKTGRIPEKLKPSLVLFDPAAMAGESGSEGDEPEIVGGLGGV